MLALLPLIQKLLLEYVTKKTHAGFSLNWTALILLLAAGIFGFLVIIFLLFALQTYAEELYGVPMSWLLTAAAAFLAACVFYWSACYSRREKAIVHKVKEEIEDHMTPIAQIIEQLIEPVKEHPLAAIILAGLAGVMAGDKIHSPHGTES